MATDSLATLAPADRARYTVFNNAVVTCTRLYNEEPTAARLRDLRAAEEAFAAIRAELLGDGPVQGADQAPPFTATEHPGYVFVMLDDSASMGAHTLPVPATVTIVPTTTTPSGCTSLAREMKLDSISASLERICASSELADVAV